MGRYRDISDVDHTPRGLEHDRDRPADRFCGAPVPQYTFSFCLAQSIAEIGVMRGESRSEPVGRLGILYNAERASTGRDIASSCDHVCSRNGADRHVIRRRLLTRRRAVQTR